jgi:hypothetical protein
MRMARDETTSTDWKLRLGLLDPAAALGRHPLDLGELGPALLEQARARSTTPH